MEFFFFFFGFLAIVHIIIIYIFIKSLSLSLYMRVRLDLGVQLTWDQDVRLQQGCVGFELNLIVGLAWLQFVIIIIFLKRKKKKKSTKQSFTVRKQFRYRFRIISQKTSFESTIQIDLQNFLPKIVLSIYLFIFLRNKSCVYAYFLINSLQWVPINSTCKVFYG